MFEFMVTVRGEGNPIPFGLKAFKVAPNVGDIITANDEAGIGQAYRVIARILPLDSPDVCGDIELEHLGPFLDYLKSLSKNEPAIITHYRNLNV